GRRDGGDRARDVADHEPWRRGRRCADLGPATVGLRDRQASGRLLLRAEGEASAGCDGRARTRPDLERSRDATLARQARRELESGGRPAMLKATLIGNLGNDPEMRYSANGAPFLRFNVASNFRTRTPEGEWQDKTEWVRVTV